MVNVNQDRRPSQPAPPREEAHSRTHAVCIELDRGHLLEGNVPRPAVPAAAEAARKHRGHVAPRLAPETRGRAGARARRHGAPQRPGPGAHKPPPPQCIQSQRLRSAVAPDGMETREENQGQKNSTRDKLTIGYRCYITASEKESGFHPGRHKIS